MLNQNNGTSFNMPVVPAGYGNGGGLFGGDGWGFLWLIALMMGWGGFGGFGGGAMWPMMAGMGGFGMDTLYPWLDNSQHISDGFRDQMLSSSVQGIQSSVTSGFGDVALGIAGINQNLCQTGNGIVNAVNGAQNSIAQQLYNGELNALNRSFAEQTANTQGFTNLSGQLAQCCCDNRLAVCQTQNLLATESAATRSTIQGGIQTILDKMCQDKIDAKNEKIVELNNKINSLEANNYIQNALTAQSQFFLGLFPPPTAARSAA